MHAEFSLDQPRREPAPDLRQAMRQARMAHGTAYRDQLREILLLGLSRNRLSPADYYLYGLCDHRRHDRASRRSFLGSACRHLSQPAAEVARKLPFERLMRAHGLPTTRTLARYGGDGPPDGVRHLADGPALGRFLRESAERRLFGKPAGRCEGQGRLGIDGWEPATDSLSLSGGDRVGVLHVQRLLEPFTAEGYLLQTRLLPHPELAPVLAGRASTVRVLVLGGASGPALHRAAWKIPAGRNIADGFRAPANLLAAVDPDTGRIWRVVDDVHPRQTQVELHPDSRLPLHHRTLPDWTMLRATALTAAELFPASAMLAFDVALTDDGPVLVGMEAGTGDPLLLQLAHDQGLADPAFERRLDAGKPARRAA